MLLVVLVWSLSSYFRLIYLRNLQSVSFQKIYTFVGVFVKRPTVNPLNATHDGHLGYTDTLKYNSFKQKTSAILLYILLSKNTNFFSFRLGLILPSSHVSSALSANGIPRRRRRSTTFNERQGKFSAVNTTINAWRCRAFKRKV